MPTSFAFSDDLVEDRSTPCPQLRARGSNLPLNQHQSQWPSSSTNPSSSRRSSSPGPSSPASFDGPANYDAAIYDLPAALLLSHDKIHIIWTSGTKEIFKEWYAKTQYHRWATSNKKPLPT